VTGSLLLARGGSGASTTAAQPRSSPPLFEVARSHYHQFEANGSDEAVLLSSVPVFPGLALGLLRSTLPGLARAAASPSGRTSGSKRRMVRKGKAAETHVPGRQSDVRPFSDVGPMPRRRSAANIAADGADHPPAELPLHRNLGNQGDEGPAARRKRQTANSTCSRQSVLFVRVTSRKHAAAIVISGRSLLGKLIGESKGLQLAELGHRSKLRAAFLRTDGLRYIVTKRHSLGDTEERPMSHQPPKQGKKQSQHTPKEKKAIKQQKKHAGDVAPFLKK